MRNSWQLQEQGPTCPGGQNMPESQTPLITETIFMQMLLRYISCLLTSNNTTQNIALSAFEMQIPCTRSSAGGKWSSPVVRLILYQVSFSPSSQFSGLSKQAGSPMLLISSSLRMRKHIPEELQPLFIFIGRENETQSSRERFSRAHGEKKSLLEGSVSPSRY